MLTVLVAKVVMDRMCSCDPLGPLCRMDTKHWRHGSKQEEEETIIRRASSDHGVIGIQVKI